MAKKTMSKPRNYAAIEMTLINLRAAKKREAVIVKRVTDLETRNLSFGERIQRLEEQLRDLKERPVA